MNQIPRDRLYKLLPAIYQLRDAAEGEPLKALLAVIEQEVEAIEEDIGDLYDNWFIETCAEWVIPYVGDLLDVRALYASSFPTQPQNQLATTEETLLSEAHPAHSRPYGQQERRAYVANTLAYRRRKGTTPVLEQLVRDVTGWRARAVEFSRLLLTTENLNHLRPVSTTVNLRDNTSLELIGTPFEQQAAYTAEVRRVSQSGRYNIPNIGLFVWRLRSYPIERSTARILPFGLDNESAGRFYTFNPLGYDDVPLFNQPQSVTDITKQAQEINLPAPLRCILLANELKERRQLRLQGKPLPSLRYFNESSPVLQIFVNGQPNPIPPEEILICRLTLTEDELTEAPPDSQAEEGQEQASIEERPWYFPDVNSELSQDDPPLPTKVVAVDPELGRIAFLDRALPERVEVSYLYGFSDDLGSGPYPRGANKTDLLKKLLKNAAQKQGEEAPETTWINPLFWEIEQVSSANYNTLDTAIQTWNRTVSAWQALRDFIHIPLARITVPPVQVILKQVRPKFKPGIVGQGLDVLLGCCPTEILITPGIAIDRQGRLLQVYQLKTINLKDFDLSAYNNQTDRFILVICYRAALQEEHYQFALVPETAIGDDGYPEGTFIPLARFKISSDNSDKRFIGQPDLSVRDSQFQPGIVQGFEVQVLPGTLRAIITPGTAVDAQTRVLLATTTRQFNLAPHQGESGSLVLLRTGRSGQQWELRFVSGVDADVEPSIHLAQLSIPRIKVGNGDIPQNQTAKQCLLECAARIVDGLEVQSDSEPMKVRVSSGKARACDNQEFQSQEETVDLKQYQDQTCTLVLCLGTDLTKGQRGSIKIVTPEEAFTDFKNYLPLATLAISDEYYSDAGFEIYPAGRVLEGLEVNSTDTGITIAAGTAKDSQGREIKLEQAYQFDLSSYTAQQFVLFISPQKRQGFPIQPTDSSGKQDWQQLGIVPQEPDPADTGIILMKDSLTYEGDLEITIPQGKKLKIIAADGCRPHINGNVLVQGTAPAKEPNQGELILDGLLIEGQVTVLPGNLKRMRVIHSTLVPEQGGLWVQPQEEPTPCTFDAEDPFAPIAAVMTVLAFMQGLWHSDPRLDRLPEKHLRQLTQLLMQQITRLIAEIWQILCPWATQIDSSLDFQSYDWDCLSGASSSEQNTNPQNNSRLEISLYRSICGCLELTETVPKLKIEDCILDKGQARNDIQETSGLGIWAPGTNTEVLTTTVMGMSTVRSLEANNSLFTEKVTVQLHQTGCIRFSHVPEGSQTPPRYQCQPDRAFKEALDPIPDAITSIASHTRAEAGTISSNPGNPHQIIGDKTSFSQDLKVNQAIIVEGQTRTIREIVDNNHLIIDRAFEHNLESGTTYQTSCLFSSSVGGGVFRSLSNGETWKKTNRGLSNLYVATILAYAQPGIGKVMIDGTTVTGQSDSAGLLTTAFTQQLRPNDRLTIAGQTRTVTEIFNDGQLTVDEGFDNLTGSPPYSFEINTVLAGTTGGRIFRSKNNGDDWISLTLSEVTSTITVLRQNQWTFTGILIGDGTQIEINKFIPKDKFQMGDSVTSEINQSGINQTRRIVAIEQSAEKTLLTLNAPFTHFTSEPLSFHLHTLLAATAGDGILRGNANGENWIPIDTDLINLDVRALAVSEKGEVLAGTAGDGVFQLIHGESEEDGGDRWIPLNNSLKNCNVTALTINFRRIIFVGTAGGGIFYFNTDEERWISFNQGLTSLEISALVATGNSLVAATTDGKIFHLADGGEYWKHPSLDLKGLNITALALDPSNQNLFAGTVAGNILRSEIDSDRWLSINTGLPNVIDKLLIMERLQPNFTSTHYGASGYVQLSQNCANELRTGAEDGAEMGVFNSLKQPQRQANLQANLEEYLRFGLEAGFFYMT